MVMEDIEFKRITHLTKGFFLVGTAKVDDTYLSIFEHIEIPGRDHEVKSRILTAFKAECGDYQKSREAGIVESWRNIFTQQAGLNPLTTGH